MKIGGPDFPAALRQSGAKYTAGRRPVRLVYQEAFRSVGKALAREYVVKQLTRAEKDALLVSARDAREKPDGSRWD
jgi:predicted GIY-YIG superfamily endonuclease